MPKIDTRNKNPSHYFMKNEKRVSLSVLANGDKLTAGLSAAAQSEIVNIITYSWEALSMIAAGRWGDRPRTPETEAPATDKACTKTKDCKGRVRVFPLKGPVFSAHGRKGASGANISISPCSECGIPQ